ncbi:HD domain-containing protein [Mesorhizobium sp. M7A.F.Ca.US.006.01.1.1]|uniref:HD domain-containing protein n=1 Tax=Mesorhizobium sp. M7A.F.Ca.US.006.01.1.1 TaxID=2496707 RepID=UPI001FDFA2A1|nr:HD domain-containing protein [Mesorhizobium sp. M7A.F.Ca.US.006.01.1.1]
MLSETIAFLVEIDRLKQVDRQTKIVGERRRENAAEHSWHLAMFALVLGTRFARVDPSRVIAMLLIHDIVEIDAGDLPLHSRNVNLAAKQEREAAASQRIFGLLPPAEAGQLLCLWNEFEAGETENARFARALDRLQPLILNLQNGGGTWLENDVTEDQVVERYGSEIEPSSRELWQEVRGLVSRHFQQNSPNHRAQLKEA